jgi:hypothetical protein
MARPPGDRRSAVAHDGNHQAMPKTVDQLPVVALDDEAAAQDERDGKALLEQPRFSPSRAAGA